MLIYRLETEKGIGIYRAFNKDNDIDLELNERINSYCKYNQHPLPYDDSAFKSNLEKSGQTLSKVFGKFIFGFSSSNQLLSWFYNKEELLEFGDAGITVGIYESENVILGNAQCAFLKDEQETNLVERLTIPEFFEKIVGLH